MVDVDGFKLNGKTKIMPRLNTRKELDLKIKISQERERRFERDIQRERERQEKLREKMKHAPST